MHKHLSFRYFFLKREPYYHKIQYSKVLKHDISAAIFGVVIGAFTVYLALNTLGSGSPDLSDLSVVTWYLFLAMRVFQLFIEDLRFNNSIVSLLLYFVNFIFFTVIF